MNEERRTAQKKVLLARSYVPGLLRLLREEKGLRQMELIQRTGLSSSTLSTVLGELEGAGLITGVTRRGSSGAYKAYRLTQEGIACCEGAAPAGQARPVEIPREARPVLERCLGPEPLDAGLSAALDRMDRAIDKLSRSETEQLWMQDARGRLDEARELGGALAETARANGMELYYAIGLYLAKLARLQELAREPRDYEAERPACQDRHFEAVMDILSRRKAVLLSEMTEALGISRCNTLIHMKRLVEAGYVAEGNQGRWKLYRLSEAGERYYEQQRLPARITA